MVFSGVYWKGRRHLTCIQSKEECAIKLLDFFFSLPVAVYKTVSGWPSSYNWSYWRVWQLPWHLADFGLLWYCVNIWYNLFLLKSFSFWVIVANTFFISWFFDSLIWVWRDRFWNPCWCWSVQKSVYVCSCCPCGLHTVFFCVLTQLRCYLFKYAVSIHFYYCSHMF